MKKKNCKNHTQMQKKTALTESQLESTNMGL